MRQKPRGGGQLTPVLPVVMHGFSSNVRQIMGWVLATAMMLALSIVCLIQWKAVGKEQRNISSILDSGILNLDRKFSLAESRWTSLIEAINKVSGAQRSVDAKNGKEPSEEHSTTHSNKEERNDNAEFDSPLIPPAINPVDLLFRDLEDILKDELLNPEKKRLGRVAKAEALVVLIRAQGMLKTLDCEMALESARGMEVLRPRGEYIEYSPGESYQIK